MGTLEAGLFKGVPFNEYRTGEGWVGDESHSSLKLLKEGPSQYKFLKHYHETRKSAFLTTGSASDCVILEQEKFDSEFAVYKGVRRGEKFEEFARNNLGKIIITPLELETARSIRDCALRGEMARFLLKNGTPQVSLRWQDEATGIWCKGRIDVYHEDEGYVVDLKTTQNPESREFASSIFSYSYYTQLAFYMRGLKALGYPATKAVIVAVTNQFPFLKCRLYELVPGVLQLADQEIDGLLKLLKWCRDNDKWPGKPEAIELIGIPEWGEEIINKRLEAYGRYQQQ